MQHALVYKVKVNQVVADLIFLSGWSIEHRAIAI